MITQRKRDNRNEYEPLPDYGWRCGFYGLEPEPRHATNPEFIDGVRSGRRQRQPGSISPAMLHILKLPNLREMRVNMQASYSDAMNRSRIADAYMRAAGRAGNKTSVTGRSYADSFIANADAINEDCWDEYNSLNEQYNAEINRLCSVRNIPQQR